MLNILTVLKKLAESRPAGESSIQVINPEIAKHFHPRKEMAIPKASIPAEAADDFSSLDDYTVATTAEGDIKPSEVVDTLVGNIIKEKEADRGDEIAIDDLEKLEADDDSDEDEDIDEDDTTEDSNEKSTEDSNKVVSAVNAAKEIRRLGLNGSILLGIPDPSAVSQLAKTLAAIVEKYRTPKQTEESDLKGQELIDAITISIKRVYLYFAHTFNVYNELFNEDPKTFDVRRASGKLLGPNYKLLDYFKSTYDDLPKDYKQAIASKNDFLLQTLEKAIKSKQEIANEHNIATILKMTLTEMAKDKIGADVFKHNKYLLDNFFEILEAKILPAIVSCYISSASKIKGMGIGTQKKDLPSIDFRIFQYFCNPTRIKQDLIREQLKGSKKAIVTGQVMGSGNDTFDKLDSLQDKSAENGYDTVSAAEGISSTGEVRSNLFELNDDFMRMYFKNHNFLGIAGELLELWKNDPQYSITYFDFLTGQPTTKPILEMFSDYSGDFLVNSIPSELPILTLDIISDIMNEVITETGAALPIDENSENMDRILFFLYKDFNKINKEILDFSKFDQDTLNKIHQFLLTVNPTDSVKVIDFSKSERDLAHITSKSVKDRALEALNKAFMSEDDVNKKNNILITTEKIKDLPEDDHTSIQLLLANVLSKHTAGRVVSKAAEKTVANKEMLGLIKWLSDFLNVYFKLRNTEDLIPAFIYNKTNYTDSTAISELLNSMSAQELENLKQSILSGQIPTGLPGNPSLASAVLPGPGAKVRKSFPDKIDALIALKSASMTESVEEPQELSGGFFGKELEQFKNLDTSDLKKLHKNALLLQREYLKYFALQIIPQIQKISILLKKLPLFLIGIVDIFRSVDKHYKLSKEEFEDIKKVRYVVTGRHNDESNLKIFFDYLRNGDLSEMSPPGCFKRLALFFMTELKRNEESNFLKPIKSDFMMAGFNKLRDWLLQYYLKDEIILNELKMIFKEVDLYGSFGPLQKFLLRKTDEISAGLKDRDATLGGTGHSDKLMREFEGIKRGIYQYGMPAHEVEEPKKDTETPQTSGEDAEETTDYNDILSDLLNRAIPS